MNKYERAYNETVKKNKHTKWYDVAVIMLAADLQKKDRADSTGKWTVWVKGGMPHISK